MKCVKKSGEIVIFITSNTIISCQGFYIIKFKVFKDILRNSLIGSLVSKIPPSE